MLMPSRVHSVTHQLASVRLAGDDSEGNAERFS